MRHRARRRSFRRVLAGSLFAIFSLASPALTQTTGSIAGRVLDAEGNPLSGVKVTVRSPSLPGTHTATTDSDGRFRLPALPPGEYAVSAEFSGAHPVEQPGVQVPVDREITLELRFVPAFPRR